MLLEVVLRRVALVFALLLAADGANAAGIGLRWNSCVGESNRNFACDRSTGSELLVVSFESPAAIDLSGVEVYLRITTADPEPPSWWRMWGAAACRRNAFTTSVDVSPETECDDPWLGQAWGGAEPHSIDSKGVDLRMIAAVPVPAIQKISSGRTYAAFRLTISHTRSNGASACEGCNKPACIVVERMVLTTPQKRDVELTTGLAGLGGGFGNIVTWQGGTPTCGAGAPKTATWGELKKRFQ